MTQMPRYARAAEEWARKFHEAYERLAHKYGYTTRAASAVPWEDVPDTNRRLMMAVAEEVVVPLVEQVGREREVLHAILRRSSRSSGNNFADVKAIERMARDALAGGVSAAEECPGCEICDLAIELIEERQLVAALTDALRQWVESYPPHRDDCRPFSEHGCSCGVEAARQATAAALAAAEDSTP